MHVSGQSGAEGAGKNSGLRLLEGSRDTQLAVAKVACAVACRCHQTGASGLFGSWTEICTGRVALGAASRMCCCSECYVVQRPWWDSVPLTLTIPFLLAVPFSSNVSAEIFVSDGSILAVRLRGGVATYMIVGMSV